MILVVIGLSLVTIYLSFCVDRLAIRLKSAEEAILELRRRI